MGPTGSARRAPGLTAMPSEESAMQAESLEMQLTPREIVRELDRYIVGQSAAKRAVAIALRSRWRRQQLPAELRDEVAPKNIIMVGPTGVGKTEIARRLARLARAPFVKVEATKYTEVGYVGRDVESMVRDLVEVAVKLVKEEQRERVRAKALDAVEERLLDLLLPIGPKAPAYEEATPAASTAPAAPTSTREKMRTRLRAGAMDDATVEVELSDRGQPSLEIMGGAGMEELDGQIKDMLGQFFPRKKRPRRLKVAEARALLLQEEQEKLVDLELVHREAVRRAEQTGIIFVDEIDKIASRDGGARGPDVSRQGVQRDILPLVEGTTVTTKYGAVRTDHVLFIAAGAFHVSKPSDLIPELQGRFPIRVELESLTRDDFVRILTEPKNALTRQYAAMLETEGVAVTFSGDAVQRIADIAFETNARTENIGARRLYTVLELVVDEVSFEAPDMQGQSLTIDAAWVDRRLSGVLQEQDLGRYIL
jgi:ATP-dependent HslUV protease ATP-binding subunit HslU